MNSITERAIAAIGETSSDDWRLQPQKHAESLPPNARLLRQVLENPALQSMIQTYNKLDQTANKAQRRYKFQSKGAAVASFLTIALGSLLVLPGYNFMPDAAISAVSILQGVLAAVSAVLWFSSSKGGSFQSWMEARSLAEDMRIKLFDAVLDAKEAPDERSGDELPLLPLQLEYFRRYLLDSQQKFYEVRGKDFERARAGSRRWRFFVMFLFAVAALPIVWEMQGHPYTPAFLVDLIAKLPPKTLMGEHIFLGITIFAVSLQVLLTSYAAISLNYRNAWRYPMTQGELDRLSGQPLADARSDAAANRTDLVLRFTEIVEQELLAEHHEWIVISKGA
jgi:hypothetical protein